MTTTPTRRTVLAGMAGAGLTVPALTPLPAAARGKPDAELFRVVREFEAAKAAWVQADEREETLGALARKEYPERPPLLFKLITNPVSGTQTSRPFHREEIIEWWSTNFDEGEEDLRQQRLEELDSYEAKCRAVDARFGVPEAKARAKTLLTQCGEAETRVYRTPASTAAGIAAKLRVAVQEYEDCDFDAETFALILADVERLGRAS